MREMHAINVAMQPILKNGTIYGETVDKHCEWGQPWFITFKNFIQSYTFLKGFWKKYEPVILANFFFFFWPCWFESPRGANHRIPRSGLHIALARQPCPGVRMVKLSDRLLIIRELPWVIKYMYQPFLIKLSVHIENFHRVAELWPISMRKDSSKPLNRF